MHPLCCLCGWGTGTEVWSCIQACCRSRIVLARRRLGVHARPAPRRSREGTSAAKLGRGPIPRPPPPPWRACQAMAPAQGLRRCPDERARSRPHAKVSIAAPTSAPGHGPIPSLHLRPSTLPEIPIPQFPISLTYLWSCIDLFWTN
jgi:hypothetical protein